MRLQYKHQKFQADATKAVVDVFAGQPYLTPTYMIDKGIGLYSGVLKEEDDGKDDLTGWNNQKIVPELTDDIILEHVQKIQRANNIKPSEQLEGRKNGFNLTIEMETGVGKTYTYIKTMYELNRAYGWSKFIVVVPNIAIREGVYKSFQTTQEHFAEEYGKKIRFFIYNSSRLTDIDRFASDPHINVMIINSQAFNARGKDARRIDMKLDEFRSRKPIDILAKTNPILIIDEPQSVEGKQTKESLKKFNPLMTLRYSATHKADSIYNMIYRLDAIDAYNKHLVKKIAVKGITATGTTATEGYLYLEGLNFSKKAPTATISYEVKMKNGTVKRKRSIVKEKDNLYDNSGDLEEYKEGYVVSHIEGRDNSIEFVNGLKLYAGDVVGEVNEDQLRRIQIRETILSHLQREQELFYKGIKVLSLFFIDEVAKYREYDAAGEPMNGLYANMFEEEYKEIVQDKIQSLHKEDPYRKYLESIEADKTHSGYFSIDKKGKMIDSKVGRRETTSDDVSAYELIMKNKELLLDRDPNKSPVRFIFSHSALREGWDNPNVFQICTLKQSSSDVRKRQEVGRGLRLCVNQDGERMDVNSLGNKVHDVNVLTVIASESYEDFAKGLQTEMAESIGDRPRAVTVDFFVDKVLKDDKGHQFIIDKDTANIIQHDMIANGYVDRHGALTDTYRTDKANGELRVSEEIAPYAAGFVELLDTVYDPQSMQPENARSNNVESRVDDQKLEMKEFKELWSRINAKSVYVVDFDTDELVQKSIQSLNQNLKVSKVYFRVESGEMESIKSKDDLLAGTAFAKEDGGTYGVTIKAKSNIKYDLIGKLVDVTKLTRKAIVQILQGIDKEVFNQFKDNPEEFIAKAGSLINDEKATAIIQHITYHVLDEEYSTDLFADSTVKGKLGKDVMEAKKHLYPHIAYDSENERKFATDLDTNKDVAVYVKLPKDFYISTPVGKYNPDWAIAFYEGNVKHIYFVAETKGSLSTMELRKIEQSKIECAREHFRAISGGNVVYDVVDSYDTLLNRVMK